MKVSDNGRYLVDDSGQPFFYLADTSWMLFHRPAREEADLYLQNRKEKGFTVVMPVVVRQGERARPTNAYGHTPFIDNDPTRPNEPFFKHVDYVINRSEELGLHLAILPTWGEHIGPAAAGNFDTTAEKAAIFNSENARVYGEFLGRRYRDKPIFWVLGGDRNPVGDDTIALWRAMVAGLKIGDGGRHLMTFHPQAPHSSSEWFHDEPWLDFNMIQTSTRLKEQNHLHILADYNRTPVKPTLDGETRYENSHEVFSSRLIATGATPTGEKIKPYHVRQAAYSCLLSGAMGHTYGCRDVWSFHLPSEQHPGLDVDTSWKQAIDFPGAHQMGFLRKLFTNYPWYRLVPDQQGELISGGGFVQMRLRHLPAALAEDRTFGLVYVSYNMRVCINMSTLATERIAARWFNPRSGTYHFIGDYPNRGIEQFHPPGGDADPDYVLVLEKGA